LVSRYLSARKCSPGRLRPGRPSARLWRGRGRNSAPSGLLYSPVRRFSINRRITDPPIRPGEPAETQEQIRICGKASPSHEKCSPGRLRPGRPSARLWRGRGRNSAPSGLLYSPVRRFSITRRITEPPYAPANPGRNARTDSYICAREGFTLRTTYAANSVRGIKTPTVTTHRQGQRGLNIPSTRQDATTSSAVNKRSSTNTSAQPAPIPQAAPSR